MTKNRELLLDILRNEDSPVNARQIHESLAENSMDLATVYRGLEFLDKSAYVQSFVFECHNRGIERYYYVNKKVHEYFIHCEGCHRFFSLGDCPVESSLDQIEQNSGFKIRDHQLILRGLCQKCRRRKEK